ncbi:MAG: c-type cytochrome [Gammaproteobacteria bacterium]|nr:c-type cytochrome [Gammaproteobacteria bacterium]
MLNRYLLFLSLLCAVTTAQAGDPLVGQKLFKQCLGCHAVGPDAKNLFGPQLNGVFERPAGTAFGYGYSSAFENAVNGGLEWNNDSLDKFLAKPLEYMPGTKMAFPGVREPEERDHIMTYLRAIGTNGVLPTEILEAPPKPAFNESLIPRPLASKAVIPSHGVLHIGRTALPEEVRAWDIDIRPDGQGLPEGSGTVLTGTDIYDAQCAACHGVFGEGTGRWPVLSGGYDTLADERPEKTIGSYWPYLSTVYDYVRRAMPFGNSRALTDDDVYAVTAYLMYLNDLVDEDFELNSDNFTEFQLPNEPNFITDTRSDEPYFQPQEPPCMTNCVEGLAKVTSRARVLDVTPEGE